MASKDEFCFYYHSESSDNRRRDWTISPKHDGERRRMKNWQSAELSLVWKIDINLKMIKDGGRWHFGETVDAGDRGRRVEETDIVVRESRVREARVSGWQRAERIYGGCVRVGGGCVHVGGEVVGFPRAVAIALG